jgi:hypothetical protein
MKTFTHEAAQRKHVEANRLFLLSSCAFVGEIIVPGGSV